MPANTSTIPISDSMFDSHRSLNAYRKSASRLSQPFLFSSALKHFYEKCDLKSQTVVFFRFVIVSWIAQGNEQLGFEFEVGAIGLLRQTGDQFHLHQ